MTAPSDLVAFCEREYHRLVGVVGLLVGDRDLAEELAQESLIRACRDWETVRTLDRPAAWLHRVAVNLAMSSHRRRRTERRILQLVASRDRELVHDPETAAAETVRRAMRRLPIELRAVVVLRFYADLSVSDTAEALRIPEGTVKTRTRRGLAALREDGLIDITEVTDAP